VRGGNAAAANTRRASLSPGASVKPAQCMNGRTVKCVGRKTIGGVSDRFTREALACLRPAANDVRRPKPRWNVQLVARNRPQLQRGAVGREVPGFTFGSLERTKRRPGSSHRLQGGHDARRTWPAAVANALANGWSICCTCVTNGQSKYEPRHLPAVRRYVAEATRGLFRARHELFRSREPIVNLTVRVYSHVPVSSLNKHKNKNCISAYRSPDC
jgi:hypothetical protein